MRFTGKHLALGIRNQLGNFVSSARRRRTVSRSRSGISPARSSNLMNVRAATSSLGPRNATSSRLWLNRLGTSANAALTRAGERSATASSLFVRSSRRRLVSGGTSQFWSKPTRAPSGAAPVGTIA